MKKNNSKKWIKTITITTAVLVFAAGAVFALKPAGTANTDKDSADTVVAAANEATDLVVKETVSEKETEVITETAATEATTEEATEAVTELPVVQTPSDARVAQVIAGINAEREAVGVAAVTYDVTLTDMAQVRASENAANDYFVIENGKHKRPDGRKASSICEDYGQSGNFGEVMGRYQETPDEIVTGWHNSASHYACMTSGKYNRVGVGIAADSEGYLYWVAIFMD